MVDDDDGLVERLRARCDEEVRQQLERERVVVVPERLLDLGRALHRAVLGEVDGDGGAALEQQLHLVRARAGLGQLHLVRARAGLGLGLGLG